MTAINRQSIDDNDMIARYLADQLSDSEREAFEAYYLEHPQILQELNRTAQFKSGLMDLQKSGELRSLLAEKPWWRRSLPLSMAASITAIVLLGALWMNANRTSRTMIAASPSALRSNVASNLTSILTGSLQPNLTIAESRYIQRTRTSSYDATIQLPRQQAAIELRIKPETTASSRHYRIGMRSADSADLPELAAVTGVEPAQDGFVPIYLDSSKLSPGVYEISISIDETPTDGANGATTPASSFLVELTAPDGK